QGKLLFFQPLTQKGTIVKTRQTAIFQDLRRLSFQNAAVCIGDQNPVIQRSSKQHKENNSSEDEQQDTRKWRSKRERWTSHKEKDFSLGIKASTSVDIKGFSWYE
nr:FIP1[V]-like protein [Tanacetum cinerariifolium]